MEVTSNFIAAISGNTAIEHKVGLDEFYNNEALYLKEIEGKWYILEEFEE